MSTNATQRTLGRSMNLILAALFILWACSPAESGDRPTTDMSVLTRDARETANDLGLDTPDWWTSTTEAEPVQVYVPSEWQRSCWDLATWPVIYRNVDHLRSPDDEFDHWVLAGWMAGWARDQLRRNIDCSWEDYPLTWRSAARPPDVLDEQLEWEADYDGENIIARDALTHCSTNLTQDCVNAVANGCFRKYGNWSLLSSYCASAAFSELGNLGVDFARQWKLSE